MRMNRKRNIRRKSEVENDSNRVEKAKEKNQKSSVEIENTNSFEAFLFDFEQGMTHLETVKVIRILSKDYRTMIMSDHTPCFGELVGTVKILTETDEIVRENCKGFYTVLNNEFRLIIESYYEQI